MRELRLGEAARLRSECVVDPSSLSPGLNETRMTQYPELTGDSRLGQIERGHEMANAKLSMGEQSDDAQTRRIAQRFEKLGGLVGLFSSKHAPHISAYSYIPKNGFERVCLPSGRAGLKSFNFTG